MKHIAIPILLLTLNPVFAQPNQPRQDMFKAKTERCITNRGLEPPPIVIKGWICAYALEYHVEPSFAMAVAHIESRGHGREFRCGLIGKKYFGPMGIFRGFLKKWRIDDTETNIRVGVRALRNVEDDTRKQKKRLHRYNASFNAGYWWAVKRARDRYRKQWEGRR